MSSDTDLRKLEQFSAAQRFDEFEVKRAVAEIGERRSGESVTRLTLLLSDPTADTWNSGDVSKLRDSVARRAAVLGLPEVVLTLVPVAEAEAVEAFARQEPHPRTRLTGAPLRRPTTPSFMRSRDALSKPSSRARTSHSGGASAA